MQGLTNKKYLTSQSMYFASICAYTGKQMQIYVKDVDFTSKLSVKWQNQLIFNQSENDKVTC